MYLQQLLGFQNLRGSQETGWKDKMEIGEGLGEILGLSCCIEYPEFVHVGKAESR
jgi:hypothetical protein